MVATFDVSATLLTVADEVAELRGVVKSTVESHVADEVATVTSDS